MENRRDIPLNPKIKELESRLRITKKIAPRFGALSNNKD
jgi:hypothetical protein